MNRSYVFPIILGLSGVSVLMWLGFWQVQRLEWKNNILSAIAEKISASPTELSNSPEEKMDQYRSVVVEGNFKDIEIHVLSSIKFVGPGFKVISPFVLEDGRVIMVDRGFVAESEKNKSRYLGPISIQGNLLWPDETDVFTPKPDLKKNIWFSRNLREMSKYLNAEPTLVILEYSDPPLKTPLPQPIGLNIPNNHLSYAITWFSLAFVWFGMTIYMLWRIKN